MDYRLVEVAASAIEAVEDSHYTALRAIADHQQAIRNARQVLELIEYDGDVKDSRDGRRKPVPFTPLRDDTIVDLDNYPNTYWEFAQHQVRVSSMRIALSNLSSDLLLKNYAGKN